MRHRVDEVKWQADDRGEWICIRTPNAHAILEKLDPSKVYDFEIVRHVVRRSNDANAYCWTLIGKLSAVLRIPPDECYRHYIRDVGDNYFIVQVRNELREHWDKVWCDKHVGRMTRDLGGCAWKEGYSNVACYLGSSDYDTRQMSRLIDLIVEDCKATGIETLTPRELDAMKEEWGRHRG